MSSMHKHTTLVLALLAVVFTATVVAISVPSIRASLTGYPGESSSSEDTTSSEFTSSAWSSETSSMESSDVTYPSSSSESSADSSESSSYDSSVAAARGCGEPGDVNCGGSCPQGKTCQIKRSGCKCE